MSPLNLLSLAKTSLMFLPWLSSQLPVPQPSSSGPITCLDAINLEQVIDCLDTYTVCEYDRASYDAAQPTDVQRDAWRNTIQDLLSIVDGDCFSGDLPPALTGIYEISQLTESSGDSYCILSEISSEENHYAKGWGVFVTPATRAKRTIHISAPHPAFELGTPQQAVALFKSTGAQSLLIPGRSKNSLMEPTECVPSTPSSTYYVTDPTYNNLEPFFDATLAIYDWQMNNGGCWYAGCAFVQLHGKAASTCHSDDMFVSSGLGTGAASKAWYTDPIARPAKTLKAELSLAFPGWNITLPSDSSCSLTATKNVVGRFLNGVGEEDVCTTASWAPMVPGFFVNIEQAAAAREPAAYEGWTRALINTFAAVS